MNKRILVTGGTGLLGKALLGSKPAGYEIFVSYFGDYDYQDDNAVGYRKLDVRDKTGQEQVFADFRPNVVIHAASIGSPDYAEKNKELTWAINVGGTATLADLCDQYNSALVYISSNGIYDGNNAPYAEDAPAKPLNYYGETKLAGEKAASRPSLRTAIVRPILLYGWPLAVERGNIVTMAINKLRQGEKMAVYDDVFSNALYVNQCAAALWEIIRQERYETFNLAGGERTNIYELIRKTAAVFGLNQSLIIPVKQGFFNELVPRPKDTSYNTARMENILRIKPYSLLEGLTLMKGEQ